MAKDSYTSKRGLHMTVLLAVTVLAWGVAGVLRDGPDEDKEETALSERVKTLESLLTHQATLLRQQAEKLSQQDDVIRQLEHAVKRLEAGHVTEKFERKTHQAPDNISEANANEDEDDWTEGSSRADNESKTERSLPHQVPVRSDDSGPLEVVVSQMGQRLTQMTADVQALKSKTTTDIQSLRNANADQDRKIQEAHTSTFVHWGSSHCSNGSQLVYSGAVGGSNYDRTGAATNYLCLTMSPVLSNHAATLQAFLHGAEYETHDSHQDNDPVCAVCRSSYSTTIMIPGTNVCTPGWHRQYYGYLMAGDDGHNAGTEFICVDSRMEGRPGSARSEGGKLLYFTKTVCGSLPCQPYANNRVVTCVVCSM